MDKTASRIITATNSATDFVQDDISKEFAIISKWGCDGSTGHSEYKRRSLEDASDSDIFITPVFLLRLYSTKTSGDKILWQNLRPSLVRSRRPIRIQLKKEAAELAKEETSAVEERILKKR
jgi:hypothetical protein